MTVDAPESSQLCRGDDSLPYRCGAKAASELDGFIAGRAVSCEAVGRDVYGRTVATCSVAGVDLNEWLVRGGLAFDWPKYSRGKYDRAQHEAEHAGRGMWAGSYVAPWLYRACVKQGGKPGGCSDDANHKRFQKVGSGKGNEVRFKTLMSAVIFAAIGPVAAETTSIKGAVKKLEEIHRLATDAQLANKYCPQLKVDNDALTSAMVKMGGAEDGVSDALGIFGKTIQSGAYVQQQREAFGSKSNPERDMACELARLRYGVGGKVAPNVLIPR